VLQQTRGRDRTKNSGGPRKTKEGESTHKNPALLSEDIKKGRVESGKFPPSVT